MGEQRPLADLADLLRRALESSDSAERQRLIGQFQESIWEIGGGTGDDATDDVLVTAANDLDYYAPRPDWRSQDRSFYDDIALEDRLLAILQALGKTDGPTA